MSINSKIDFLKSKYQKPTLIISSVSGFVSDFLSPLGPILKYISIIGFSFLFVLVLLYFYKKTEFFKNLILPTSTFSVVSAIFFFLNSFSTNGILSDNIPALNDLQGSLSILQEDIERVEKKVNIVEEKVQEVDVKVDELSNSVFSEFEKIESLIEDSNPFLNPKTADEFLINAFVYKNTGKIKVAIESFESFFKLTNENKVDLLIDYYQLIRTEKGKRASEKLMQFSDIAKYIYDIENLKSYKLLKYIDESEVDEKIKKWTYIYKYSDLLDVGDYPESHKYSNAAGGTFTLGIDFYRFDKELGEDYNLLDPFFYKTLSQIKLVDPSNILAIQSLVQYMYTDDSNFDVFFNPKILGEEKARENQKFVIQSQKNLFMNGEF